MGIFLFATAFRTALECIQPSNQWVPGPFFPGVEWPELEDDHSPPSSVDVKNAWGYTGTPPIRFNDVVLN